MKHENYRRYFILAIILVLILGIAYFALFFAQGFWHNNVFLYKTGEGTFKSVTGCVLKIQNSDTKTDLTFTADSASKHYEVIHGSLIEILEDGKSVYSGGVIFATDRYYLKDDAGNLILSETGTGSDTAFPSRTELLNWALWETPAIHGNPAFLIYLGISAILLMLAYVHRFFKKQSIKPILLTLWGCVLITAILSLIIH